MNKYEQALQRLIDKYADGDSVDDFVELKRLVDTTIAKKVERYKPPYGSMIYFCPSCDGGHTIEKNQKYCDACGQKLDWSKE